MHVLLRLLGLAYLFLPTCCFLHAQEIDKSAWLGVYMPVSEAAFATDVIVSPVSLEDPYVWGPKLILREDQYEYWYETRDVRSVVGRWKIENEQLILEGPADEVFPADEERGVKMLWFDKASKMRWDRKGDISEPRVLLRVEPFKPALPVTQRPSVARIVEPVASTDLKVVLDHLERGWPECRLEPSMKLLKHDSGQLTKALLDKAVRSCVDRGFCTLTRQFIEIGGSPDATGDATPARPLGLAVLRDDVELAKAAVNAGCDVNLPVLDDWNAATCAYAKGRAEIGELRLKNGAEMPNTNVWLVLPLCRAAQFGDTYRLRRLLLKGASVNGVDSIGYSAVRRAELLGHEQAVKLLIEFGATPPES